MLGIAALAYAPFVFLGFGTDVDSYLALEAGNRLLAGEPYVPSRNPGYLLHELLVATLARAGGSLLSNTSTALAALVGCWCVLDLCRRYAVPHAACIALTFALHPVVWIASTSSIDYPWALAGVLGGLLLFLDGWHLLTGLAWGLAIGFRLSSAFPILFFMVFVLCLRKASLTQVLGVGCVITTMTVVFYSPSWAYAQHSLAFLEAHIEPRDLWTWKGHVGRFGFKNLHYVFGVPGAILLLGLSRSTLEELWRVLAKERQPAALLALGTIVGIEGLYVKYPLEPGYLIPALPFVLILLSCAWQGHKGWFIAFCGAVLSLNLVTVSIAKPDQPGRARTASLGVWVQSGALVRDTALRLELRQAQTHQEWERVLARD